MALSFSLDFGVSTASRVGKERVIWAGQAE